MSTEIERKFLVHQKKLPPLKNGRKYLQGYFSLQPHVRFRIIGNKLIVTIKEVSQDGRIRKEWELFSQINQNDKNQIAALAIRKPITKTRYKVKYKKLVWEIDFYQGENKGLITADIEIPRPDFPISFPSWVDTSREITNDPRYFNANLGENPYKKWVVNSKSGKKTRA